MDRPVDASGPIQRMDDRTYLAIFDLRIYSPAAVKKAAYKFAADFSAILTVRDEHRLEVRIHFAENGVASHIETVLDAFCNEVIDQDLRELIAKETEATRNLILAEAFSKTSLLHGD